MTTIEQLLARHDAITQDARSIAVQRGDEYATTQDTLKTFREVGAELGMRPSVVASVLLSIKHKRLVQQLRTRGDIKDSVRDLINYGIYVQVLVEEEEAVIADTLARVKNAH